MIKNLKIGIKIGGGFSLVLILLLAMLFVSFNGYNNVSRRVDTGDDANRLVKMILEARQHEKNYMMRLSSDYITKFNDLVGKILKQAEETKGKFRDKYNIDQMDSVITAVKSYKKAFTEYIETENIKKNLMTEMRASAKSAQNEAESIRSDQKAQLQQLNRNAATTSAQRNDKIVKADGANRSIKLFLDARKNEKEYIISEDKAYLDKWKVSYDATIKQIRDLKESFKLAKNISQAERCLTALVTYKSGFDKFIAAMDKQKKQGEQMVKSARNADAICLEARKDQKEKLASEQSSAKSLLLIFSLIALSIGIVASVVIARGITIPLIKGVEFAKRLSAGDLAATVDVDQKDEVGQLALALRNMVEKLRAIVSEIMSAAENVAAGSEELSSTAQEMSQGATEQSASAEEVSSSMEQMTANIQQNTDNAQQTEKISVKSSEDAKESGDAVNGAVSAMNQIAEKISVIQEIARQTNLLALNAAIEAARAGEHGKGFAVVAGEVRKLAERSQNAAGEITDLAQNSVSVAERAGSMLTQLVPDIQKTADLVQEITASSNEQNSGAGQINAAIQQLDQVIQQNASASEEMASTSEELASQAEQMRSTISFFKLGDSFSHAGRSLSSEASSSFKKSSFKAIGTGKTSPSVKGKGGVKLDLSEKGDAEDDEFERY